MHLFFHLKHFFYDSDVILFYSYLKNLHFTAVNSIGLTIFLLRCSVFHYLLFPILYLHLCVLSIIIIEIVCLNFEWCVNVKMQYTCTVVRLSVEQL